MYKRLLHILYTILKTTLAAIITFACLQAQGYPELRLSGIVLSEKGKPLAYTNIVIPGTDIGTISDSNGVFILSFPPGDSIQVSFSYAGYRTKTVSFTKFEIFTTDSVMVVLEVNPYSFSPVNIIGESALNRSQIVEPSLRILTNKLVENIPAVGGSDVFRSLQFFPGVNSSSELSNQLYVRGGTPDQNLILINGVPVYQPFHLFGLSSSVEGKSVDFVRYYSGGFSVRFGDRMSSVVDIVTKPGGDSLTLHMDWNLISAGGTVSGPLADKFRWRLTGRRTYFDGIGLIGGFDFPYHFSDVEGKLSYVPNPKNLMILNAFLSTDEYSTGYERTLYNSFYARHPDPGIAYADSNRYRRIDKSEIGWRNLLGSVRWLRRHSESSMSQMTLYYSSLSQTLFNQRAFVAGSSASKSTLSEVRWLNEQWHFSPGKSDVSTGLFDLGIRSINEWALNETFEVALGGGYSLRRLDYFWNSRDFDVISPYVNVFMDFPPDSMNYNQSLITVDAFAEIVARPTQRLWVRGGMRLTNSSHFAAVSKDPRMNLTWEIHPHWKLKAGWGQFSQSLSSSTEYGFYSVASLYFPSPQDFSQSTHLLGGVNYDNGHNLVLDLLWYSKTFSNLLYVDREGNFRSGTGESFGVEVWASFRESSSFSSQLAYAYSVVEKTYDGESFYPNYDQRHKINWQASVPLGENLTLIGNWTFSTGRPANLATSMAYTGYNYVIGEGGFVYWGLLPFVLEFPKNVVRYPPFHRLDITLTRSWNIFSGTLSAYIQVFNLYARRNIVYYKDISEAKEEQPDPNKPGYKIIKRTFMADSFDGLPFLPTIGLSYEI